MKILSTLRISAYAIEDIFNFFKISFLLKLNLSKNRDCCKFHSFATAPFKILFYLY